MLSNIRLQNFRSYIDSSFEFESGVNIVVGPNASGKTNLLEAISYLMTGKSFRAKDFETVMFSKPWARIDGYASGANRVVKLVSKDGQIDKQFDVDGKIFKRLSRQHTLPVVIFEPNHLLLLHGSPEGRRSFLDLIIDHETKGFASLVRDYKKTLAQRNSLLKSGRRDSGQLFVWNVRLSEQGGRIVELRQDMIAKINQVISETYSKIAAKEYKVRFMYTSSCNVESYSSSMMKKLELHEKIDYERGFTSFGPHRDDIAITIDGKLTSQSASRGEARTMLLALKIFELDNIEVWSGKEPVLLLDDVFSELDGSRRRALTEYLEKYQSFITTTDADILSHKLVDNSNVILF